MGKSNHTGATGRDQGAVKFTARPKTPEEKVDGCYEQGSVESGRQAGSLIADAHPAKRRHRLPVIQHGFFQPGFALQGGSHPIGALKHLARHLRIARLVGAKQSKRSQAIEAKESAERYQQQNVGAG